MTPKCITTLQSTQPGRGTDNQWFSSRDRRGSFQCLSSFPWGHPLAKQTEGNCVTGHWSRLTTFKSPVEQKDSHTICSGTLPGEGTACRAHTQVRKEEQGGHVLPLVLPCFIGLPGLCNIWLFTGMIKGQMRHHSCVTHNDKDSTTAHVQAFWMGKVLVYHWNKNTCQI